MLFDCRPKVLHKHCLQFLLGVKMVPRETENNAYAKFWGDKQRTLWYVMVFLEWSIWKWRGIAFTPSTIFLFFPLNCPNSIFLAHCAVNLSFMVYFACLFILKILNPFKFWGNFIQNAYFDHTLIFYKFHKFLNSYPKEDATFQNPIHVWLASIFINTVKFRK